MDHTTQVQWTGKMSFEADIDGHKIKMDTDADFGGENTGAKPKALLLAGLAGCTGMDVVSLLNKMRVDISDFKMTVTGKMAEEHPKIYEEINLKYEFWGKELPEDKIEKAINLSKEKYCAVSAMLSKAAKIKIEVVRHENK